MMLLSMFIVMAFGFKEILWDSGAVWVLVLMMMVVWIINQIKSWTDRARKNNEK